MHLEYETALHTNEYDIEMLIHFVMFRRRMASWRVEDPRFLDSYRSVFSVLNSENVVNAAQNPTPTIHPHNNTCRGHFLITARRFPGRLKHQDSQQESQHQFMVDDGFDNPILEHAICITNFTSK